MGEGFIIDDRNIKVNFIGKAQATQVFHTCEQCSQPIIYYGRMIPCKVFKLNKKYLNYF